jgi:hypothetical protein
VLRHQLIVLKRRLHCHVRLTNHDRWFFIQLYRSALIELEKSVSVDTLEVVLCGILRCGLK